MSHTPVGSHPPGWDIKLADRSSLPPVPGEERARVPFPPYLPEHSTSTQSRYHGGKESQWSRRHSSQGSSGGAHQSQQALSCCCDGPEGSSGRSPVEDKIQGKLSPPSFLRWARTLHDLLEDAEGVRLFQAYVRNAGILHSDRLDFYFACQGLKQQTEQSKVKQMVGAIYKFLRKSQLMTPEDVKRVVKSGLKEGAFMDPDVFDKMQQETERLINETTYPSFLRSDTYIQHARSIQQAPHSQVALAPQPNIESFSSGSSSSGSREQLCSSAVPMALATLHEGEELKISQSFQAPSTVTPQRLTKDLLMATQNRRLQPETFSGGMFVRKYSVYSYPHMAYSAYCPASRQDSELQSLSSGRTDSDAMSMSGSSVDGVSVSRGGSGWGGGGGSSNTQGSRRHLRNAMLDSAAINRDPHIHDMVIPRTFRIQKDQCRIMKPEEFAPLLIEKLEKVKRDLENQEKLDRKLMENDGDEMSGQAIPPRMVAAALREKLQLDDDNDQDILDQHVSRVWSDLTPLTHSPGGQPSPPHVTHHAHHHGHHIHHHHRRRERDVQSTHSADSGNVRDLDGSNICPILPGDGQPPQAVVSKSRSVPDYGDPFLRQPLTRRSLSKKTLTELTDSGVSVVSDVPLERRPTSRNPPRPAPAIPSAPTSAPPLDTRVLAWIQDHPAHSPACTRRSYLGSRASSAERSGGSRERPVGEGHSPAQPFAADPQMPPPPRPHTPTQLDEARRRLLAEQHTKHSKRSGWSKNSPMSAGTPVDVPSTVVVFTFLDEQFPYRTKIPSAPVTLKHFKEYLPKKGNYRYFFKTECEDLDNSVIQEEIFNDSDVLPLWEGKIMARVKNME